MSKVNVCLHREQRASATRHRFIQAHYHVCCMYQAHAFRNDITMKSQILFFLSSNMKCITQRERSEKMRNKMRNLAIWLAGALWGGKKKNSLCQLTETSSWDLDLVHSLLLFSLLLLCKRSFSLALFFLTAHTEAVFSCIFH